MHENANIAFELRETRRVLTTVLAMQPRLGTLPGTTPPDQQVNSAHSWLSQWIYVDSPIQDNIS